MYKTGTGQPLVHSSTCRNGKSTFRPFTIAWDIQGAILGQRCYIKFCRWKESSKLVDIGSDHSYKIRRHILWQGEGGGGGQTEIHENQSHCSGYWQSVGHGSHGHEWPSQTKWRLKLRVGRHWYFLPICLRPTCQKQKRRQCPTSFTTCIIWNEKT